MAKWNHLYCFKLDMLDCNNHTHQSTKSAEYTVVCSKFQIHTPYAHMNSFMYSFVPNTTSLWNGLPMIMFSYVEALIYANCASYTIA